MTITVDIRPEIEAELVRQAAVRGRAVEDHAATLLEGAIHLQAEPAVVRPGQSLTGQSLTGQSLVDACAKVRGLLSDQEIDTMFSRTSSSARPVDFE